MKMRMHVLSVGLVLALAAGAMGAMMSGPADRQLDTAITHAGLAARQTAVAQVELHLHHVLNCIEGKDGKNYFAGSGDVCEGMGRGLLADLGAAGMAGGNALPFVEIAQSVALWGISQGMRPDLARARAAAELAQLSLQRAKANFK